MIKCNKSVYLASKSIDMIDAVNKGYADGYNKAIDDFVRIFKSKTHMENKLADEIAEQLKAGGKNEDNCDGKCTNCDETDLPNIKDKDCKDIGYSYAYKTDCNGDRYIKVDEVRYLLKRERNKYIDEAIEIVKGNYRMEALEKLEQLKESEEK